MSFKYKTTELSLESPFKGKGILNDRLRFDTSGISTSNPQLLVYNPTTKAFTWNDIDSAGVDTLYSSNGTISTDRVVSLDYATGSLQFSDDVDEANYFYFQPNNEFSASVINVDYERETVNLVQTLVLGNGSVSLSRASSGTPFDVVEDPADLYVTSKAGTLEIANDYGLTFEQYLDMSFLEAPTAQYAGLSVKYDSLNLNRSQIIDTSNSEATALLFQIGDLEGSFGMSTSVNATTYSNANINTGSLVWTNNSGMYLSYESRLSASLMRLTASDINNDETFQLNLTSDLDQPVLYRSSTSGETHSLYFYPPTGIALSTTAIDAADGAEIVITGANSSGSTTSVSISQGDTNAGSSSNITLATSNALGTVQNIVTVNEDNTTFYNTSVAPTDPALVTFTSTVQGVLLPRMTTTERNAIASPVAGLIIYNTTTNKLNVYTTAWEAVTSV